MRAYHTKKRATIVARPRNTNTAIFADELLVPVFEEVDVVTVGAGVALGVVTVAGALKRKV
jgi:hypothetical protein